MLMIKFRQSRGFDDEVTQQAQNLVTSEATLPRSLEQCVVCQQGAPAFMSNLKSVHHEIEPGTSWVLESSSEARTLVYVHVWSLPVV